MVFILREDPAPLRSRAIRRLVIFHRTFSTPARWSPAAPAAAQAAPTSIGWRESATKAIEP